MKSKVSFDFDDTLSNGRVQHLAKLFVKNDFDVWVVTSRMSDEDVKKRHNVSETNWNNDLWFVCEHLNIPKDNVIFTCYSSKHEFFWSAQFEDDNAFLFHLDDDEEEIRNINAMTDTKGVVFPHGNKNKQLKVLKELKEKFL